MGIGQIWRLNNLCVPYLDAVNCSLETEDFSDGIKLRNWFGVLAKTIQLANFVTNSMMGFVYKMFAMSVYCPQNLRSLCHTGLWHTDPGVRREKKASMFLQKNKYIAILLTRNI